MIIDMYTQYTTGEERASASYTWLGCKIIDTYKPKNIRSQTTLSISSSSWIADFLAWWRPKCWSSKAFIDRTLDLSWASCKDCSERGKPTFAIISLYSFKHCSRIFLLKTSTREPVDGISPLFNASSIWNQKIKEQIIKEQKIMNISTLNALAIIKSTWQLCKVSAIFCPLLDQKETILYCKSLQLNARG